jgi:hypothetical protein
MKYGQTSGGFMKKIILFLLLTISTKGFSHENIVFAGLNGIGITVSYEKYLTDNFSIAPEINFSQIYGFLSTGVFAELRGRWYPFSGSFFVDTGIGYGILAGISYYTEGLLISPGFGWKIDAGKKDGFVFDVCICSDWVLRFTDNTMLVQKPDPTQAIAFPAIANSVATVKLLAGYSLPSNR